MKWRITAYLEPVGDIDEGELNELASIEFREDASPTKVRIELANLALALRGASTASEIRRIRGARVKLRKKRAKR